MKIYSLILNIVSAVMLFVATGVNLSAQSSTKYGDVVEMDRVVYDFGDVQMSAGPVSCTFTAKNISSKPMVIYTVVSSCGCTDVKWTREPIQPGKTGTVTATYKNDEGPYPFDKTLTVYVSELKQPIILRLKGVSRDKKVTLQESYNVKFGNLGFQSAELKGGNLSQGQQKTSQVTVANLGKNPIKVEFTEVSPGLEISLSQNPIPAGQTARLSYTISASRSRWGKNYYYATPVVDGKKYKAVIANAAPASKTVNGYSGSVGSVDAPGAEAYLSDPNPNIGAGKEKIAVYAFTKEDFASMTEAQKKAAPQLSVKDGSTFEFGKVKAGTKVDASFTITNPGKETLKIYKLDSESNKVSTTDVVIPEVAPGKSATFHVKFDTTGLAKGETSVVLLLTTNAPTRPIVNLYITGWII